MRRAAKAKGINQGRKQVSRAEGWGVNKAGNWWQETGGGSKGLKVERRSYGEELAAVRGRAAEEVWQSSEGESDVRSRVLILTDAVDSAALSGGGDSSLCDISLCVFVDICMPGRQMCLRVCVCVCGG